MKRQAHSISEFCEAANIGREKAYELINTGKIRSMKVGGRRLISARAIEDWIATSERETAEAMGFEAEAA